MKFVPNEKRISVILGYESVRLFDTLRQKFQLKSYVEIIGAMKSLNGANSADYNALELF